MLQTHRTVSDMREKQKHCRRSAGFVDRRVIVHRSADRGAVRLCTLCSFSAYCAQALAAVKPSASFWCLNVVKGAACGFPGALQITAASGGISSSSSPHLLLHDRCHTGCASRCLLFHFMMLCHSQFRRREEKLQWAM